MSDKISETNIQSCITAISFPRDLEGFVKMILKNDYLPIDFHSDLDLLIYSNKVFKYLEEDDGDLNFNWSAPRWMTSGDILFYYHSKTSKYWSRRVLRENLEYIDDEFVLNNLIHAVELAEEYSGKIIGCSELASSSEFYPYQDQHFKGRTFVEVKDVTLFKHPVSLEEFSTYIKISRAGTNTPISRNKDFQGLKKLILSKNDIPNYLKISKIGDKVFSNISKSNWKEIACKKNQSFRNEDQIRAYFIDYFLDEIKDPRTSILEECGCFYDYIEGPVLSGIVDYFIKVNSTWIPVEAKLNVLNEENINHQLSKYVEIDYFSPTRGLKMGNKIYNQFNPPISLLIDQFGIYTYWDDKFINCSPGKPVFTRVEMKNTQKIRDYLIKNLEINFGMIEENFDDGDW